jgi:hypothetical protein
MRQKTEETERCAGGENGETEKTVMTAPQVQRVGRKDLTG